MYNVKYISLIEKEFNYSWRWKAGDVVSVRDDRLNQKPIFIIPWNMFGGEKQDFLNVPYWI